MPNWVDIAVGEFVKRLKEFAQINLVEIPLIKRNKASDNARILDKESNAMISAIPVNSRVIALAIQGQTFTSEQLAIKLNLLVESNSHLCFLIGGPEGLTDKTLRYAIERWSLSALTLPHTLARVLLVETLYRAWTIITNHPYHK